MNYFIVLFFSLVTSFVSHSQSADDDSQLIIDKLLDGEEYSIAVDSKGYIRYSDTITVSRNLDLYTLEFNGILNILSSSDINQIRDFEKQINNCCSHVGCSEISIYSVTYKDQNTTLEDYGCELDGVGMLMRKLNIEYR